MPPVPDVQADLQRRGIAVEHHPHRGIDLHTRGPQAQEQRTTERRQDPVQRRHRVEDHHHGVVEEPAGGQRERRLPELLEDRLVRPARPAQLLGEEVGPGRGPLADREHVRGVDRAPLLPGLRVAVPVHLEAGRHVLGDRVVQPADLLQRADAYGVGRTDEHRGAIAVAGPLDQRMEEELLRLGGLGDEGVVIAVHLRADDEADVRVAEESQHPLQVVGQRDVVGVDGGEVVIGVAVRLQPGVVVAVLGLGTVRALGLVPLRDALAAEVVDAQAPADFLDLGVVALVQQPDVQQTAVADLDRRLQRLRHHGEGFLARYERGEEGDAGAALGYDRDGVAGDQGGMRVGQHIHAPEQLDQPDRDQHDDVQRRKEVIGGVVAFGPVGRLHQPDQQPERDQRRGAEQQGRPYAVRFVREQRAVADLVGLVRVGPGERPGQPAVVLVVIARQRLALGPPLPVLAWHAQARRGRRVVRALRPGAVRRRRHESIPRTQPWLRAVCADGPSPRSPATDSGALLSAACTVGRLAAVLRLRMQRCRDPAKRRFPRVHITPSGVSDWSHSAGCGPHFAELSGQVP